VIQIKREQMTWEMFKSVDCIQVGHKHGKRTLGLYKFSGLHRTHSQTRNVGAAASSVGACMYVHLYTYIMLCYTYTAYTLCMHKHKKHLCQEHKINTLFTRCTL
jgi:hypothetical protein